MGIEKAGRRLLLGWLLALALCGAALAWEEPPELVPGGSLVGIRVEAEGVVVAAVSDAAAGLRPGDVITALDGQPVHCIEDFKAALAAWAGESVSLRYSREGAERELSLAPTENETGAPELGLWLRDGLAGLGTLSFTQPETGLFGALGHAVNDVDSGVLLPLREGSVAPAELSGAVAGSAGRPGELLGSFDLTESAGSIEKNTEKGVFGRLESGSPLAEGEALPALARAELREGPAVIRCNVDGAVREYAVRIDRLFPERSDGRDLMLTVTDPNLLALTGGIVQGMSGSPILQDGRLAGAVTHVLVNDPARGYGISIETMLEAMDN